MTYPLYPVTPQDVRNYLLLADAGAGPPSGKSRYEDAMLYGHIAAANSYLEHETHRYLADHGPVTWSYTTLLRAQVQIPGFRSFTNVSWGPVGGSIVLNVSLPGDGTSGPLYAIPDELATGVYIALQQRPWRVDNESWYLSVYDWWGRAYDSPFFPGNLGGGFAWTSMPNDLVIQGLGGWAAGSAPDAYRHALLVLSAFFTKRATSILADVAITPGGGVIHYSRMPDEARMFIDSWKLGEQAVSVG
jgi:hypothetical protein